MDDVQRMQIERECERLVTAYCHLVDHGQAAQAATKRDVDVAQGVEGFFFFFFFFTDIPVCTSASILDGVCLGVARFDAEAEIQ